eukprot:1710654-Prymnesium_polylepis.1
MGQCISGPMPPEFIDEADPTKSLRIVIKSANRVPKMDVCTHSDTYVRVQWDKTKLPSVKTKICKGKSPVWDETVSLPGDLADAYQRGAMVRFTMMDKDYLKPDAFIGVAVISIRDLVRRPSMPLL